MVQDVAVFLARVTVSPTSLNITIKRDRLLEMLTDKYGEPTRSGSDPSVDPDGKERNWEWILPMTDIKLSFVEYQDSNRNILFLIYRKRNKQSDVL